MLVVGPAPRLVPGDQLQPNRNDSVQTDADRNSSDCKRLRDIDLMRVCRTGTWCFASSWSVHKAVTATSGETVGIGTRFAVDLCMDQEPSRPTLRRTLGLTALTLYGVGDILGAGIYALVGTVVAVAGSAGWMSFGVAMSVATLSGLTYAELIRRYPRSGGEAWFAQQAFGVPSIGMIVGWLVLCSGVVSLATVAHAFSGYLHDILPGIPKPLMQSGFLCVVAGISFRGMRESSAANIAFTLVEGTGLIFVIVVALSFLAGDFRPAAEVQSVIDPGAERSMTGILHGAAIAFFAFVGFEDMVNVAEEVKEPGRHYPIAIVTALVVAGGLYITVCFVATAVVPVQELAGSTTPLLDVVRRAAPWSPEWGFTLVALFAVANTGLLNLIMASRLLYGMSDQQLLPRWFGAVHESRQTPHHAIIAVFAAALLLTLSGSLQRLAETTSAVLLCVFVTVNVSLIAIRLRESDVPKGFHVPLMVPVVGAVSCLGLIAFVELQSIFWALGLLAVGIVAVMIRWLFGRRAASISRR